MKPFFRCLELLLGLIFMVEASSCRAADPVRITLMLLNDVYQISPVDKGRNGGLARVATLRQKIAQESPNSLLILGGDTISPSVASSTFKGEQMIAAWNAVGLDLAVLGNHEFDFGPEILKSRLGESRFTWLGANVIDRVSGRPFGGIKASEMRVFDGIKVGFLGVVTDDTPKSSRPGGDIRFLDPIAVARREAAILRRRGANLVVAITHLGIERDRILAASGAVDLILGGHDHTLMHELVGHTPIFKVGSDARLLGRIDLAMNHRTRRLEHISWTSIPVTGATPDDPAAAKVIQDYESRLAVLLDVPVGDTAVPLDARQESNRSRETNLGSWLADIYRTSVKADVAIINGGSIRSNAIVEAGKLTRRDVLTLLPFENPIVKLKVPGKLLREALEHGIAELPGNSEAGKFPQVSGLRFSFDANQARGSRIIELTVGGAPLDESRQYSVALNGYLAEGRDGYAMFKGLPYLLSPENAPSETSEVIDALARQGSIAPKTDGRIMRVN
jgi:5'-nucleotidase